MKMIHLSPFELNDWRLIVADDTLISSVIYDNTEYIHDICKLRIWLVKHELKEDMKKI